MLLPLRQKTIWAFNFCFSPSGWVTIQSWQRCRNLRWADGPDEVWLDHHLHLCAHMWNIVRSWDAGEGFRVHPNTIPWTGTWQSLTPDYPFLLPSETVDVYDVDEDDEEEYYDSDYDYDCRLCSSAFVLFNDTTTNCILQRRLHNLTFFAIYLGNLLVVTVIWPTGQITAVFCEQCQSKPGTALENIHEDLSDRWHDTWILPGALANCRTFGAVIPKDRSRNLCSHDMWDTWSKNPEVTLSL